MDNSYVLAMYDVRGIQNYIFRTTKLKDAIGASAIVETIIADSLEFAVKKLQIQSYNFEWEQKKFDNASEDVCVLYVGGGNAYVLIKGEDLCLSINKLMSRYVLENTYSLQLAAAFVPVTDNYQNDYRELNKTMTKVKADMPESKPVGALPIMDIELATGLPATNDGLCVETVKKNEAEKIAREKIKNYDKRFDNYIEEKDIDSTIAVVHIDGNNMGLRIRGLVENSTSYVDAVNLMRKISYSINHAYKDAFDSLQDEFNKKGNVILKAITAGDDITYICNGKAAIASVEYFVNQVTSKTMTGNPDDIEKYGFSVCAGIAYIRSHFPFAIAYEVAEACCESAKDRAKENAKNGKVGNFFDFQFCKNVQTIDIDNIRKNEYVSPSGESLLVRPFEIGGDAVAEYSFDKLRKQIMFFANLDEEKNGGEKTKSLPRSFAKELRNTYPLGMSKVNQYRSFLESRNWKMPDGDTELYIGNTAKYYDALELMDDYKDLKTILNEKEQEGTD